MELYINENSITGQASNREEALILLEELFTTFSAAKNIAKDRKGYLVKDLSQRFILKDVTIQNFLQKEINETNPIERKFRTFALGVLFNKPRMDPTAVHFDEKDSLVSEESLCLKNTCFDHASSSKCSAMVISMMNNEKYTHKTILIESSIYGKKKVLNITNSKVLFENTWIYEHHTKHARNATLNGSKIASPMTLNQSEAETALLNGILINRRVYSFYKNKWYKFHCQENNKFHGFEFTPEQNNIDDELANSILHSLNFQPHGQIFSEYL